TSWAIKGGTLAVWADNSLGNSAGSLSFAGGTLQFLSGFTTSRAVTLNAGGGTFDVNGNNATLAGTIGGAGGLTKIGAGTLALSGRSSHFGAAGGKAGTLQAGATGAFSPLTRFTVASGATLNLASFNQTIGSLAGAGSVTLGSATLTTGNASPERSVSALPRLAPVRPKMVTNAGGSVPPLLKKLLSALATLHWLMLKPQVSALGDWASVAVRFRTASVAV